jgi:uncharacterized membrane protein
MLASIRAYVNANFIIFSLLILAAWLYFKDLGESSFGLDEAYSWKQSTGSVFDVISATAKDNYPPLHNLILNFVQNFFGSTEFALRTPSALCMILTIFAIYRFSERFFSKNIGICACFLILFSQFNLYYAQEARNYALLEFLSILYVGSIFEWIQSYDRKYLFQIFLYSLLLSYTQIYGVFLEISMVFGLLINNFYIRSNNSNLIKFISAHIATLILYIPWIFVFSNRIKIISKDFWISEPSFGYLIFLFKTISGSNIITVIFAFGIIFYLFNIKYFYLKKGNKKIDDNFIYTLITIWLFGPFIIGYIISITIKPILFHRYLITSYPALLIIVATGYHQMLRLKSSDFVALVASLSLINFFQFSPHIWRDNIRQSSAAFQKYAKPDDCVYILDDTLPFEYYLGALPQCRVVVKAGADINPQKLGRNYAWLFITQSGYWNKAIENFNSNDWTITAGSDFGNNLFIINHK